MGTELRKDVENAGKRMLNEVDCMASKGILPLTVKVGDVATETITAESLRKTISDIMNSDLTIAVCGIVNAGKSTFLNSILFGRNVLPTFPTPCTAKLTFITHTDKHPGLKVRFFKKEDFSEMQNQLKSNAKEALGKAVKKAQDAGVSPYQLWGTVKEMEFNSLDELNVTLREYASEDGRFTPFVKEIELRINRPEIKGLYIVDTPGLDDPNPLNSRETEVWAQRAHAVIFLMPWKGMGETGKSFVESNFGKMSEEGANRVFVITRIDQNDGWPDTIRKFKSDFPAEASNICAYSAYVDLLFKAEERGETTPDDEFTLEKWRQGGFNHDPSDVRTIIARRLFEGGGKDGAKFKIRQLGEQIKRCYNLAIAQSRNEIELLKEDIRTLGLEKDEAQRNADRLKSLKNKLQNDFESILTEALNSFANGDKEDRVKDVLSVIRENTERILSNISVKCKRDALILPTLRLERIKVEDMWRKKVQEFFNRKIQNAEDALYLVVQQIDTATRQAKCEDCIKKPDITPFKEESGCILKALELEINFEILNKKIHWYNKTVTNMAEVLAAFAERADEIAKTIPQKMHEYELFARNAIRGYVGKTLSDIDSRLDLLYKGVLSSPEEKQRLLSEKEQRLREAKDRLRIAEDASVSFECCS